MFPLLIFLHKTSAAQNIRKKTLVIRQTSYIEHSRPVLVASVEDHERVGLSKEVLLVQLVGTELHSGTVLQGHM